MKREKSEKRVVMHSKIAPPRAKTSRGHRKLTRSSLTLSRLMHTRARRFRNMQRATAIVFLVMTAAAMMATAQETPAKPPANPWSSSLGAGIAFTSGNSDTKNINVNFNTAFDPKTDRRFKADALYLRGESGGTTNVDKAAADARYERDF